MRNLSDKVYENRKKAALEIEAKVRDAKSRTGSGGQVQKVLDCLRRDYLELPHPSHKKGGLIGLASVAIGLENEIGQFLSQLVLPVLELFKDEDARVRYYACESLYNISKVAGEAVLTHFHEIFDGLCKLYADVDNEVKSGVQVLDRLMKDIVTQGATKFQVEKFVPLLASRMQYKNPFIRQLVLAWITLLLKKPEVDMVLYLPQYLEGLFNMFGDHIRDIRHNADACLNELLKGVVSSPPQKALQIVSDTTGIVVRCCFATDACSRLTALCWLHEFVSLHMQHSSQVSRSFTESWVAMLPELLGGTLNCIDDLEDEIVRMANEMNNGLLDMVSNLENSIPVDQLVEQLLNSIQVRDSMVVRTACLQWICMLLVQSPVQMLRRSTLDRLCDPIFDTLQHPDDEVMVAALRVLAQIMEGRNPEDDEIQDEHGSNLFQVMSQRLLRLFASDRQMLESRGRLMIRQLCGHLDPRRLYMTVARSIQGESDLEFAQQLVQTFSWILLTSVETKSLREELLLTQPLEEEHSASRSLFHELLEAWFHDPVSALALCLWAQQYEMATELTARFAAFEPTLDLLTQLDRLVHLIESPVFSRLRLRLLEPQRHPALLKCLLGLAMLLPQAGAFSILRERIHVVQSSLLLEGAGSDAQAAMRGADRVSMEALLQRFDAVTEATQG